MSFGKQQRGALLVTTGVITPINGLKNGGTGVITMLIGTP